MADVKELLALARQCQKLARALAPVQNRDDVVLPAPDAPRWAAIRWLRGLIYAPVNLDKYRLPPRAVSEMTSVLMSVGNILETLALSLPQEAEQCPNSQSPPT